MLHVMFLLRAFSWAPVLEVGGFPVADKEVLKHGLQRMMTFEVMKPCNAPMEIHLAFA